MTAFRAGRRRSAAALLAGLGLLATLAGCGAGAGSGTTTVNWWTWDDKQAIAYQSCADAFERAHPDIHVKITQYDSADYFTKLLSGFVSDTAPDAFMNSVQYLQQYASLKQLMPLDSFIDKSHVDMGAFSVGVNDWKYTDGKQYGLPMDWASAALYYNTDMLAKAGYTAADVDHLTWNPDDGGSFEKMVAHLTVDRNGVRGDQPGFDKHHVKVYGISSMVTVGNDFNGLTTWRPFASSLGWRAGNKASWPTEFTYDDPRLVKTFDFFRDLTDKGFAPAPGEFASAGNAPDGGQLLGSGKVAIYSGGSWEAATLDKLPGLHVGTGPLVAGPDGTRATVSNANGNVIWSGTKHPDQTWAWVSYMGSVQCQSTASRTGTFLPSIPAATEASVAAMAKQGVDLGVFLQQDRTHQLLPNSPYANGTALQAAVLPLMQQFFAHQKNGSVFPQMAEESRKLLTETD
ncbi:carbohydrate ABC transporter substrate-binding protein, CUT1 family [Actinacidiphila yanglinensis]|uniref:Carbohydrate ABC transporter substrate-binding protein, CUT1 family n=1 Tax=Actinacidiphila yanglinensis TaxID=310779 RepID=A0A1H6DZU3_9ACTN|nr:sugar ABC transporter substrate-binding protein [Actinacidiphila yanglinensis]SEG90858.1 carbohydrate ABC transporter substrate-binding protein, CUT1 family [Actinacidiphila yanglinensis]